MGLPELPAAAPFTGTAPGLTGATEPPAMVVAMRAGAAETVRARRAGFPKTCAPATADTPTSAKTWVQRLSRRNVLGLLSKYLLQLHLTRIDMQKQMAATVRHRYTAAAQMGGRFTFLTLTGSVVYLPALLEPKGPPPLACAADSACCTDSPLSAPPAMVALRPASRLPALGAPLLAGVPAPRCLPCSFPGAELGPLACCSRCRADTPAGVRARV